MEFMICKPGVYILPSLVERCCSGLTLLMDFLYSEIMSPDMYRTDGLCNGIDLRRHKDPMGEIRGAIRCQKDWSKLISPVRNYKGALGSPFSIIRVTVPECLPDRLEIISYANEFAFLYDGKIFGFSPLA